MIGARRSPYSTDLKLKVESVMKRLGIIGNGVAATTAIRELRSIDDGVKIEVFSDERHAYYPRPKLIDYIGGDISEEGVIRYNKDWYESQDIDLHLSTPVSHIDSGIRSLKTPEGPTSGFDSLLIATGCTPFVPPFSGVNKKNVHVLRTLDDAIEIKEAVRGASREIIVGGGILGIELAAAIKKSGGDPIVITNIDRLLPIQLDGGASEILIRRLDSLGIGTLLGFSCTGIVGEESAQGVVSGAGDSIEGDLIVIATGVRSNVEIARNSPRIYAAGDVAEWNDMWYGIIPWALSTARIAARNMIEHGSAVFEGMTPASTLQVAGVDLTSIGTVHVESPDFEQVVSVNREAGTYFKAVIKDGIVIGGIAFGDRKVAMKLRSLISSKSNVSGMRETIFES
ncbi:MAG: NAD(P)/FAD-dependent oxidoreductase [Candidatus Thorarchaeota archaeon]|nr:NAD(P)/FAD-dependent oxidoreductase [Candidatus Thorarchaeota archaeon]